MKIQYASDLHLEFKENKHWLLANPIKPVGDVLILAGDIILFGLQDSHNDFFDWVSDHFKQCYWIAGNHEYYYADLADRSGVVQEKIRSNVTLVNNMAIDVDGVQLVLSTLWTHISPVNKLAIQRGMSDFHVIQYKGRTLNIEQYNAQHEACLDFLQTTLAKPSTKRVVVTHHVPTLLNYPKQYIGSILNEGFAVELFSLIESSHADYWIYGHHHQATPAFSIGSTKLLTNQLGYVHHQEHGRFNAAAVIDLD